MRNPVFQVIRLASVRPMHRQHSTNPKRKEPPIVHNALEPAAAEWPETRHMCYSPRFNAPSSCTIPS